MKKLLRLMRHFDVKMGTAVKRMEVNGDRDFYARYVWSLTTSDKRYECKWEGFAIGEECLNDMIIKGEALITKLKL